MNTRTDRNFPGGYDDVMELLAVDAFIAISLILPLVALWVVTFWDIARRKDLSGVRKVLWSAVVLLTAYVGIAAYAILRPIPLPPGKAQSSTVPRASAIVGALEDLVASHSAGEMSDATFDLEKRTILGLNAPSD